MEDNTTTVLAIVDQVMTYVPIPKLPSNYRNYRYVCTIPDVLFCTHRAINCCHIDAIVDPHEIDSMVLYNIYRSYTSNNDYYADKIFILNNSRPWRFKDNPIHMTYSKYMKLRSLYESEGAEIYQLYDS